MKICEWKWGWGSMNHVAQGHILYTYSYIVRPVVPIYPISFFLWFKRLSQLFDQFLLLQLHWKYSGSVNKKAHLVLSQISCLVFIIRKREKNLVLTGFRSHYRKHQPSAKYNKDFWNWTRMQPPTIHNDLKLFSLCCRLWWWWFCTVKHHSHFSHKM